MKKTDVQKDTKVAEKKTLKEALKDVVAVKDTKNGVTRPKAGTSTGDIWEIADTLSTKAGAPADRASVLQEATKLGINPATAATQYGRWRKYHGLVSGKKAQAEKPAIAINGKKVTTKTPKPATGATQNALKDVTVA